MHMSDHVRVRGSQGRAMCVCLRENNASVVVWAYFDANSSGPARRHTASVMRSQFVVPAAAGIVSNRLRRWADENGHARAFLDGRSRLSVLHSEPSPGRWVTMLPGGAARATVDARASVSMVIDSGSMAHANLAPGGTQTVRSTLCWCHASFQNVTIIHDGEKQDPRQ